MAVAGRRQALQRCQALVSLLSLLHSFIAWVIDFYYLNCHCLFLLPLHSHVDTCFLFFGLILIVYSTVGRCEISRARFSPLSTGRLSIITRLIHDYYKRSSYYFCHLFQYWSQRIAYAWI